MTPIDQKIENLWALLDEINAMRENYYRLKQERQALVEDLKTIRLNKNYPSNGVELKNEYFNF